MSKPTKAKECAITVDQLKENFEVSNSNYTKIFRKLKVLDAVDRSKLWEAISAKFPAYQILPDSNWVSYIKSNLLASIYTVAKGASLIPTSDDDKEIVQNINVALEYIWDIAQVGYYQMQAGSNAALFNIGITQVGWNPDTKGGDKATFYKGDVVLKNIHPLNYMRDPFAEDLQSSHYVMTWSNLHKTVILGDERYRERFQQFIKNNEVIAALNNPANPIREVNEAQADKGYYKVFTHFVKYNDPETNDIKIAEVHSLDNDIILWHNDDIKPSRFPFVELFCNLPEGDVVGTSECARVLANNLAYNILNSMMLTSEYKNQRPPRFVNAQANINIPSFSQYGNDPDRTFVVNGDASRAVHYHQFPQATGISQSLVYQMAADIQATSGVDGRYTGRDSGSVITTGGIEDMLNRVTTIDTPKIQNYEMYTRGLTDLILANFVEFSMERTYFQKDILNNNYKAIVVNYKALTKSTIFRYTVSISSELPKNKQRLAAMANTLMEKQMQYAGTSTGPDLITTEEWLQFQDLPNKEFMQKRMGIQRHADATAQFAKGLFDYASLIKSGVLPDDAVGLVGANMAAEQTGQPPAVDIAPFDATSPDKYQSYEDHSDNDNWLSDEDWQAQQAAKKQARYADPSLINNMAQDPGAMLNQPVDPNIQADPEMLSQLGKFF